MEALLLLHQHRPRFRPRRRDLADLGELSDVGCGQRGRNHHHGGAARDRHQLRGRTVDRSGVLGEVALVDLLDGLHDQLALHALEAIV